MPQASVKAGLTWVWQAAGLVCCCSEQDETINQIAFTSSALPLLLLEVSCWRADSLSSRVVVSVIR